jgi:protein-glutamine gamma-glutamyltransferase
MLCSRREFKDNGMVASSAGTPTSSTSSPRGSSSSAERFFQWSLYLLLVTGFSALLSTSRLDLPSVALVIPALLLRGYFLLTGRQAMIPERWTTYLTLAYFVFYAADYFYFSQSFVFATVHMVLFSVVVKIFSVRRERDLVYLAVLSFLLVLSAAVLTVHTGFLLTFCLFIVVAMATLISMEMRRAEQQAASRVPPKRDSEFHRSLAGVAAALAAMTIAGSAVIFFVLPRINTGGYLRNFGVQSAMVTGFSQEVRLGGIGQIQQSDAVVMHVQVSSGRLPHDVKWRGIALANFDGQRWWNSFDARNISNSHSDLSQTLHRAFYSGAHSAPALGTLEYRVIMEPVGLNVFFLAPVPLEVGGNYPRLQTTPDGAVFTAGGRSDSDAPQGISLYSAVADVRDPEPWVRDSNSRDYPPQVAGSYLHLPPMDARIQELARRVTASSRSNYERARAIESYLKDNFEYTLELGDTARPDPVAYFLFQRRKGHCEYFASSMTVMLRTIGIPARVVNGFRGGEYNDVTGSYIVREKDAHSWVEVYFPEFGWVTFDPTASAPAPAASGAWARAALYLDAAREMWREWIINYDFSHQARLSNELSNTTGNAQSKVRTWTWLKYRSLVDRMAVWQRRMQKMSPGEMAIACVVLAVLLSLPFASKAWRNLQRARMRKNPWRAPKSAASFWYLRLLKRLARSGIRKTPAQTPAEFASSISDLEVRQGVVLFTEHYQRARFAGSVEDAQRLPELYEEMAAKK